MRGRFAAWLGRSTAAVTDPHHFRAAIFVDEPLFVDDPQTKAWLEQESGKPIPGTHADDAQGMYERRRPPSFGKQMGLLLRKRFTCARRDKKALLSQHLLP